MSRISFDALAKENPEYASTLRKLTEWMAKHPDVAEIEPKRLARDLRGVDPVELATTLSLLVRAGQLQRVYKVVAPSGVLAEGEFADPSQIPERVSDRFENYFDTSDADVVPLFKKVA